MFDVLGILKWIYSKSEKIICNQNPYWIKMPTDMILILDKHDASQRKKCYPTYR